MPATTRTSTFSYDPGTRRGPRREHWIPVEPGMSDLKPRAYPSAAAASGDEQRRREIEDLASGRRR